MNEVYVVLLNNDETGWSDELESIHKTHKGALETKHKIEKQWKDDEIDFSSNEIRLVKTEIYD